MCIKKASYEGIIAEDDRITSVQAVANLADAQNGLRGFPIPEIALRPPGTVEERMTEFEVPSREDNTNEYRDHSPSEVAALRADHGQPGCHDRLVSQGAGHDDQLSFGGGTCRSTKRAAFFGRSICQQR